MGAEFPLAESKNPVARPELRDHLPRLFHHTGEFGAQDPGIRSPQAGKDPDEKRVGPQKSAVGAVYRGCMDPDQDLLFTRNGLRDVGDPENIRGTIAGIEGGFHTIKSYNEKMRKSIFNKASGPGKIVPDDPDDIDPGRIAGKIDPAGIGCSCLMMDQDATDIINTDIGR
jgi:hypothetical protein